jgi:hypothetical protein
MVAEKPKHFKPETCWENLPFAAFLLFAEMEFSRRALEEKIGTQAEPHQPTESGDREP